MDYARTNDRSTITKGQWCSKEKLSELKCAEWWYQWLSQALLIKAERSVVLARFTRVLAWDHYERIDQIPRVRGE